MSKKLGFNIVMLGMIASGKDTQANILKKKYKLKTIETGEFTRKLMKEKSLRGDRARKVSGKGGPLPTDILQDFLKKEIKSKPKDKDLLFLGGRLKPEAMLLRKMIEGRNEKLFVLYITLPDKEVYRRSELRMRNADDAKYIKKRIAWHKDRVGKTVQYYQKLGILKKINGNKSITEVTKDILKEIEKYKNNLA